MPSHPPVRRVAFFGFTRYVLSFAKVVIAGTLLVMLVYSGSFMEKADAVLMKAQAFRAEFLTKILGLFKK